MSPNAVKHQRERQGTMSTHNDLGGPAARPLATYAKGSGFESPIAQHVQRLISRALRSWFTGIELVLDMTTWVHFLLVPLNSIVSQPWAKVMCIQSALANQAIHPFGVGKLVSAKCQG